MLSMRSAIPMKRKTSSRSSCLIIAHHDEENSRNLPVHQIASHAERDREDAIHETVRRVFVLMLHHMDGVLATVPGNVTYATTVSSNDMLLRVITLNCWGLRFVSRHRLQRIKAIAQHLKEQQYDIVFLQELWCQSDFDHIKSVSGYRFGHYFKTSCVAGTSGLAIFSKWSPETMHFEPYTVNGSPFKPHHGDWFAGKGVAYVRIDLLDLRLHLFCTHMHAQYDEEERMTDPYSVHRICQAYQLSKFINLVAVNSSHSRSGSDLIILAGDLNTSPGELPFKLLMSMTGLVDCAMHRHSHAVNRSLLHGNQDVTIDEDLITCGHHSNTYSVSSSSQTTVANHAGKELTSKPSGKRIDFILYKLAQTCSCENECRCNIRHSCHGIRDFCHGKDPVTGLSFSDHQPVTIKLVIKKEKNNASMTETMASSNSALMASDSVSSRRRHPSDHHLHPDDECISSKERALKTITSTFNFKHGSIFPSAVDQIDGNHTSDQIHGFINQNWSDGGTKQRSHSIGPVIVTDNESNRTIGDFEKEDQLMVERDTGSSSGDNNQHNHSHHNRKTLLDIIPGRRANSLNEAMTTTTTIFSNAKVTFNPESAVLPLDEPSLKHLESMHELLIEYMDQNRVSKRRFYVAVLVLALLLITGVTAISSSTSLSSTTLFHMCFAITALSGVVVLLTEFTNRMERTAIKSITEEVSSIISFAPNHLSAN